MYTEQQQTKYKTDYYMQHVGATLKTSFLHIPRCVK